MESMDYWRLSDSFNVPQAACLITGNDPAYMCHWDDNYEPEGYTAVITAIKRSLISGRIKSDCYTRAFNTTSSEYDIEWHKIYIELEEIKRWLKSKGITTGFFFPEKQSNLPYMDKKNPYYAPKLSIAIMAWEEVTNNPYLLQNKSPKKAIEAWLETNASKFDLSTQAIGEIAKIANWNTKGGAPCTPNNKDEISNKMQEVKYIDAVYELPDEIPF